MPITGPKDLQKPQQPRSLTEDRAVQFADEAPVHPQSRLARPKQPQAWKGPHPFLQAHGFSGDINSFNSRVQKVYQGYTTAFGKEPSPGLVWDVARAVKVVDQRIGDLFHVPLDQRQVRPAQAHLESQWNGEALHVRQDGRVQPTNPITALHDSGPLQGAPEPPPVIPVKQFQKRYPMIQMGMFPQIPFGSQLWKDFQLLHGNSNKITETIGNMMPQQLQQLAAGSGMVGNQLVQGEAGVPGQESQAAQYYAGQAEQAYLTAHPGDAAGGKKAFNDAYAKAMKPSLATEVTQQFEAAHRRNSARQEWLLNHDPYHLFQGLHANGIFDKNWMTALDKWSRTPGAAYQYMQSLATQNYFNPTPQGVAAMQAAFKEKQAFVNSRQGLGDRWMAQSMPLKWFSNHTFPDPLLNKNLSSPGKFFGALDQSMHDFWSYETTGLDWKIFPAALLQMGFRGFKLAFNTMGGAWNQSITDVTGVTSAFGDWARGKTTKQIAKDVYDAMQANPDMVRMLGFGTLPKNLKGTPAELDAIGNFLLQTAAALLIHGPGYSKLDETAPLGVWKRNPYLWLANKIAYTHIKAGDLGAAELIFGGSGADPFIHAMEKGVQDGSIPWRDFHNHATEFARNGRTTLPDGTEFGGAGKGFIHPHLVDKNMPKHVTGLVVRDGLHRAEKRLETWGMANRSTATLHNFLQSQRNLLLLAQPLGKSPELYFMDVRNFKSFIVNNGLMSEKDAAETVNKYIRARAVHNTATMGNIRQRVIDLFEKKFPRREAKGLSGSFEALLSTEGLSKGHFPSMEGRFKASPAGSDQPRIGWTHGRDALNVTDSLVHLANEAGRYWRTSILATGPGLFYKHATRDPIAAFLGGMKLVRTADMREARKVIDQMIAEDPQMLRRLGTIRHLVHGADTVYSQSLRLVDGEKSFDLMDEIHATERQRWIAKWLEAKPNKQISVAAGEFLRRQVTDPLYPLYEEYRVSRDAAPMVKLALENKDVRTMVYESTRLDAKLKKIKAEFRESVIQGQLQLPGTENALKEALRLAKQQAAADYVEMVIKRWDGILEAGRQAGVDNIMAAAHKLQLENPGLADGKLGDYLLKNRVNITVPDGKIIPMSRWDRATSKAIRAYMIPNRLARKHMFDQLTEKYFVSFTKMGWDQKQALEASVQAAKTATMFHLLDFSNMIELERKYRGLLPFFTKHRLFIKWLAGTIVHRPALVGPLQLIGQHLDPYLRANFHIGGLPVNLSFARLLFLSSEQMPPTIPLFGFTSLGQATGLGAQWTRIDPLLKMWTYRLFDGLNYDAIAGHLDPYTRARLDKYMALYAIRQRMKHGLDAYVSPHEALKYAMLRLSVDIPVNGLFLTPLEISSPDVPAEVKTLTDQYDKLLTTNPQKAQALLAKHPEIGLSFGRAENFNVYNHMTQMWGMYAKIRAEYNKVEDKYSQMELEGKTLTPADYKAMHAAAVKYSTGIQNLRLLDAQLWNHDTGGKGEPGFPAVSPAEISSGAPYGPWYTQFSHDPLGTLDKLEQLFGGSKMFSAQDLHNIYGHDLQQYEVALASAKDATTRDFYLKQIERLQGAQKVTKNETFYQAYRDANQKFDNKLYSFYKKSSTASGEQKALLQWKAAELIREAYANPTIQFGWKRPPASAPPLYVAFKNVPGLIKAGNLNLNARPIVQNADGSISTVRSITIGPEDGKFVLLPTVVGNKVVSDKAAIAHYQKTGENLGVFTSEKTADSYAVRLHNQQAQAYGPRRVKVLPFPEYSQVKGGYQAQIAHIFGKTQGILQYSFGSMTLDQRKVLGLPQATPAIDAAWHDFEYNTAAYQQQTGKSMSSNQRDALAIALNRKAPGFWKDYKMSQMPRSFILLDYAKGAFAQSRYGEYWRQVVMNAAESYNKNKYGWSNFVTNTLYPFIEQHYPAGFVAELKAAGGANFLITLNTPWG